MHTIMSRSSGDYTLGLIIADSPIRYEHSLVHRLSSYLATCQKKIEDCSFSFFFSLFVTDVWAEGLGTRL